MGLRDKRETLLQEKAEKAERDANPDQQWEYLARNLQKVPGIAIENDFNKHGRKGWEFVGITGTDKDHYAIFKRRRGVAD